MGYGVFSRRPLLYATDAAGCIVCYASRSGREIWRDIVHYPYPVGLFRTIQANEDC